MNYPVNYKLFSKILADSLDTDGLFIMRFFVQIEKKESPDDVIKALLNGKIGSFHAFKWRLAMALQEFV